MTSASALAATVYAPPPAIRPWRPAEVLGHDRLRFHSLARWSLVEALKLAGAGAGKPVLFPDFICRELLASAAVVGAPILFYRVGADLSPAEPHERWPAATAVVAADFFGFPQDLAPFEAYARRTGALVIEDAAHALFSNDTAGCLLGTRAPLGIFSLRKSLALPDGGALAVNDAALWSRVEEQLPAAADAAPALAFMRRRRGLRRLSPWLGARATLAALGAVRAARGLLGRAAAPAPDGERVISVPPEPCPQLLAPIVCADPAAEVTRRRALYALCGSILAPTGARPVFPSLPAGTAPYLYPYRVDDASAVRAERALRRAGLASLPWPDLPDAIRPSAPEYLKNVRGVHFLW